MHYSFLNHKNFGNYFKNNDILSFKQQQIKNLKTIEHFLMEENSNTTQDITDDTNTNTVLQGNIETIEKKYNPNNRFNINRMMKLNKTYDAYKGSEIKVNNPPIAPYPFGWR